MTHHDPSIYPKHPVEQLATAELTHDMIQTLSDYFSFYEVDGVVTVEITDNGLWLPNPLTGRRQFLGLARFPGVRLDG